MNQFFVDYWPTIVSIIGVISALISQYKMILEIRLVKAQLGLLKDKNYTASDDSSILVKPTERQIQRLGRSSKITTTLIVLISGTVIFMNLKLNETENKLQLTLSASEQNDPVYHKKLAEKLDHLALLKVETDSLKNEIHNNEKEYSKISITYLSMLDSRSQNTSLKSSIEDEVNYLKFAKSTKKTQVGIVYVAIKDISATNANIVEIINKMRFKNEKLRGLKTKLLKGLVVESHRVLAMEPIEFYIAHLNPIQAVPYSSGSPASQYYTTMKGSGDTHYNNASNSWPESGLSDSGIAAILYRDDILTLVRSQIKLTKYYNDELIDYNDAMHSEIQAIKKKLGDATMDVNKLKNEIEDIKMKRDELNIDVQLLEEEFTSTVNIYSEEWTKYENLIGDFNMEYRRQLILFDEISEIRLELELQK
ncbi:MAG: hypothetical protein GY841_08430 [FCB group bacterium]|nr:hypothetical protein [FCB group bacterium]